MTSSTSQEGAGAGFGAAGEMFSKMWADFASKMAASGMAAPGHAATPDMARQMRDTFFAAWSDACDRYMRSDEFQQMMRESMHAAIELRKQLNEQFGEFQHAMQGASRQDVDRLLHSVDRLEGRVNETFEQLMERLTLLAKRVEAVENGKPTGKARASAGTRKTGTGARKKTGKAARGKRAR